jgi:hypothetical protein
MTRGLIEIACCRGVVSRARMRYGHVSSELVMLLILPWRREILALPRSTMAGSETTQGAGLGNYSATEIRIFLTGRADASSGFFKVYVSNSEKGASPGPRGPATSNKLLDFGLLHVQFRISAVFGLLAAIGRRPGAGPTVTRSWRSRKPCRCWRALDSPGPPSLGRAPGRASLHGPQITVSSPARCSLASINTSRRSVLTRSPAFIGISDGATTTESYPKPVSNRCNPKRNLGRLR